MRYAVGDDYARELDIEFYRALLAHLQPKTAAAALTMARQSLLDPDKHNHAGYAVGDHATPVLYGAEAPGLVLPPGRSPGLDTRDRRLHRIAELTAVAHEHFVGRTWQLAQLGADFIGARAGDEAKPVAIITGLGGMGKTALTAEALPQVEARLNQVQGWWQQHRSDQSVPDAPDSEFLARAFTAALDITKEAHFAQEDWEPALRRIDAILEVKRALRRPSEDIAIDRTNRAIVLGCLGHFGEAQAEMESCLQVFRKDPINRALVLSSLAGLFDKQGDAPQAITQERRALTLREQLSAPSNRAISHSNLANYLECSGTPSDLAESALHQLAALVYRLVAGLGQDLQTSLRNYAIRFRRAQSAGVPLTVPRVADLLADPAFRPLDNWLRQRQADVTEVQAAVDQALESAQQMAKESG